MADETKSIVKSFRVSVLPPETRSPPPPPLNPATHCNHSTYCCSVQFMLQNHANFGRSATPARLMYYQNESWLDFSSELLQNARSGFLEGKQMMEVSINGSKHIFDFASMLQIDIINAKQRSIAWIDENGNCFFPKEFVGDEFQDFAEELEKAEI